jgi:hypothetical protein
LRRRTCSRTAAHIQRGPQRLLVVAKTAAHQVSKR